MLHFNERMPSLCVLESLPELFAIDEAESNLFRPFSDIYNDAGCWSRFLRLLSSRYAMNTEGCFGNISWCVSSTSVWMRHSEWENEFLRSARTLEVRLGNQILVAGFLPHVYVSGGRPFADHRFVVGCSDDNMVPLVLLFSDLILGDECWEADSQDISKTIAFGGARASR